KAIQKTLQLKSSSSCLIKVLQEFTNDDDENDDELSSEVKILQVIKNTLLLNRVNCKILKESGAEEDQLAQNELKHRIKQIMIRENSNDVIKNVGIMVIIKKTVFSKYCMAVQI
ncbi:2960_t:CDS:2, partial [Ambispora leptoticha]